MKGASRKSCADGGGGGSGEEEHLLEVRKGAAGVGECEGNDNKDKEMGHQPDRKEGEEWSGVERRGEKERMKRAGV